MTKPNQPPDINYDFPVSIGCILFSPMCFQLLCFITCLNLLPPFCEQDKNILLHKVPLLIGQLNWMEFLKITTTRKIKEIY